MENCNLSSFSQLEISIVLIIRAFPSLSMHISITIIIITVIKIPVTSMYLALDDVFLKANSIIKLNLNNKYQT